MEILNSPSYAKVNASDLLIKINICLENNKLARIQYREESIDSSWILYNSNCWFKRSLLTRDQFVDKFKGGSEFLRGLGGDSWWSNLKYMFDFKMGDDEYETFETELNDLKVLCDNSVDNTIYVNSRIMSKIGSWSKNI